VFVLASELFKPVMNVGKFKLYRSGVGN